MELETTDLESLPGLERRAAAELAVWQDPAAAANPAGVSHAFQAGQALQNAARRCRFAYTLREWPQPY